MKGNVHITLKNGVLDVQGQAVARTLNNIGFPTVKKIRIGKFVEIDIDELDKEKALETIDDMCKKH